MKICSSRLVAYLREAFLRGGGGGGGREQIP